MLGIFGGKGVGDSLVGRLLGTLRWSGHGWRSVGDSMIEILVVEMLLEIF